MHLRIFYRFLSIVRYWTSRNLYLFRVPLILGGHLLCPDPLFRRPLRQKYGLGCLERISPLTLVVSSSFLKRL